MKILTLRVLDGQKEQLKKIVENNGFATLSEWLRDYIRKEVIKNEKNTTSD